MKRDLKSTPILREDNKKVLGVCGAIGDYFEIPVWLLRVLTFASLFLIPQFTLIAYVIFYAIFDKQPKSE